MEIFNKRNKNVNNFCMNFLYINNFIISSKKNKYINEQKERLTEANYISINEGNINNDKKVVNVNNQI